MTKKFAGAALLLALLINSPQVSADEVETFGAEFDDSDSDVVPFQNENSNRDDNFGSVLIFDIPLDDTQTENPPDEEVIVVEKPPVQEVIVVETPRPSRNDERILPPSRVTQIQRERQAQKKLKTQKARFVKLAVDDTYTYYLDRQSVSWKRMPYSASEYMLDVWIRMIELDPDTSDLPADLAAYINDKSSGEIETAREKGIAFAPVDVEVLQHKKYFLEHYYLRPKSKQIQFLCELEVIGHPQNTISERAYEYKNWEYLIPGSVESMIYNATIKIVGTSGASERGHMTFTDMLEEYGRISLR